MLEVDCWHTIYMPVLCGSFLLSTILSFVLERLLRNWERTGQTLPLLGSSDLETSALSPSLLCILIHSWTTFSLMRFSSVYHINRNKVYCRAMNRLPEIATV